MDTGIVSAIIGAGAAIAAAIINAWSWGGDRQYRPSSPKVNEAGVVMRTSFGLIAVRLFLYLTLAGGLSLLVCGALTYESAEALHRNDNPLIFLGWGTGMFTFSIMVLGTWRLR